MNLRRILLLLALLALGGAIYASGLHERLTLQGLRDFFASAGPWAPLLFIALFALEGLGAPGALLMLTSVLLWPPGLAFLLNWAGALCASLLGFGYARYVGRDWVARRLPARMRRFERRIETHGLQTVILMRLVFFLAPPAHWALGLSPVSLRDFVLGSAIGLVPGLLFVSFAGSALLEWLRNAEGGLWLLGGGLLFGGACGFAIAQRLQRRRRREHAALVAAAPPPAEVAAAE